MNDNAVVNDIQINRKTLNSFITYKIVKFRQGLDVQEHRGGNGRPSISMQKRRQVLKLAIDKETPSLRTIAQKTGVSYSSARRILHQSNATPYHKYKTQKLGENHKARRVEFSKWMLKHFGCERSNKPLGRLINTDFSAKIKVNPARNSKNDVVWSTSRSEAGDILNSNEEKFSVGEMVWGGISWRGLVPAEKPVFVSDLQKKFEPTPKSVNGDIYAYLVENIAAPAVRELYPDVSAIWQDDPASIHRCQVALEAVSRNLTTRFNVRNFLTSGQLKTCGGF